METPVNNGGTILRKSGPPRTRGRPLGSRNRRTIMAEKLMEGELEDVVRAVVAAARGGDMVAARLVLERLAPARKGRPVTFMLPCGTDAAGLAAGFDAVLAATAAGELTPDEGASVSAVLEARRKVLETLDFAERLSAFEKRISRSTGRNKK